MSFCQDTAGQERFHALGPIYYRDSNGAILVYDVTDEDSFQKVWVDFGEKNCRFLCFVDILYASCEFVCFSFWALVKVSRLFNLIVSVHRKISEMPAFQKFSTFRKIFGAKKHPGFSGCLPLSKTKEKKLEENARLL